MLANLKTLVISDNYIDKIDVYNFINSINSKYLYPNPTSDQLHLSISDFNGSNYQLILIDILGQEVYYSPVKESETTHDISRLASGIYTWRLITDNTIISTGKLIKE